MTVSLSGPFFYPEETVMSSFEEFVVVTIQHGRRLETEERMAQDMEAMMGHKDPELRAMIREARS